MLEHCQEPGYRTLAQEGLQQAAQPKAPVARASLAAATDQPASPQQQQAPDPYDQGLLLVELQGRPSELDQP